MKQFLPVLLGAVVLFSFNGSAHAQFTGNIKTNTINGVHSNWVGNGTYVVGSNTFKDVLQIINGGVLSNGTGYIGYEISGSSNAVTVTGTGSIWSNSSDLYIGDNGSGNSLTISNGGRVFAFDSQAGLTSSSSNNTVIVTGVGSVWSNNTVTIGNSGAGSTMTISNGGAVIDVGGYVGYSPSSSKQTATITGTGSVWSNNIDFDVGAFGTGNTLTIANGGALFSSTCFLGEGPSGSNNVVTVTGTGSVWSNSLTFYIGSLGGGNQLIVTNGGTVFNGSGFVGYSSGSNVVTIAGGSVVASNVFISYLFGTNNVIRIDSGSLFLTSAADDGALVISQGGAGKGELILNGGSVTVDSLIATNGLNSVITFNGGTLTVSAALIANSQDFVIGASNVTATYVVAAGGINTFNDHLVVRRGTLTLDGGTAVVNQLVVTNGANGVVAFGSGELESAGTFVTNGQQFVVGNGALGADFHLLGGVHSFNNGLRIRNAATLSGCGTVNGDVTVDSGGTVFADCGTLTFTGTVTNNYALAADGTVLEFYGTVVNNGGILLYNGGKTDFHGTFINNGIVSNAGPVLVSSVSRLGDDMVIQAPSTNGFRYELQFSTSVVSPVWTNSGAPQSGTGSVLTFTDPGGATNKPTRFYQVDVIWP